MFGLFQKKDTYKKSALEIYRAAMDQSRDTWFYAKVGVPDSYDGRFDCLLLHLVFVIGHMRDTSKGRLLNQDIFDVAVADFDQSLREIGVGDTGMKRRMKNMMLAFNGRMHVYTDVLQEKAENSDLGEVLVRNLYGTVENPDPAMVSLVSDYVRKAWDAFAAMDKDKIFKGQITYPDLPEEE